MAYRMMRAKATTKFGKWLDKQMRIHDISAKEVASRLHCTYNTIYRHRSGDKGPTFSDIVAYCWVFACKDDPETIWKLVDISAEEN